MTDREKMFFWLGVSATLLVIGPTISLVSLWLL